MDKKILTSNAIRNRIKLKVDMRVFISA